MNEAEARGILGISPNASLEDAKKAHRSLVKVFHPDLAGSNEDAVAQATQATARINEAWTTLQELAARGLLGRFVDEPRGPEPQGATFRIRRRAPHSGECMICGSYPATQASLKFVQTFLIWAQTGTVSGSLCRACGLEMFRDAQARNLTRGWWGIGVLFMVVYLFSNWGSRSALVKQPPPAYRDFSVVTPTDMPLLPGRPVFKRPSVVIVTAIVAIVGATFIWASSSGSSTSRPPSSTSVTSQSSAPREPGGNFDDVRQQLIADIESDNGLSQGRQSCLASQVRSLTDGELISLQLEQDGIGSEGSIWTGVFSACQGPFEGDCFVESGNGIRFAPCTEMGVNWQYVQNAPSAKQCPYGTIAFTSASDPSAWCMMRP